MLIVWPGEAGETYVNNTGKVVFQVQCAWHNTCGACAQYDGVIVDWWSPLHRGCQCILIPVFPGKESNPYTNFQETIQSLPESSQEKLVGKANWQLIQEGTVDYQDVVTPTRVRTLEQVVSRNKLTVQDMTDAGVSKATADTAHGNVNTPEHILADKKRQELVQKILDLGVKPKTLKQAFGEAMAGAAGAGLQPRGLAMGPATARPSITRRIASRITETAKGAVAAAKDLLAKVRPKKAADPFAAVRKATSQVPLTQAKVQGDPDFTKAEITKGITDVFGWTPLLKEIGTLAGAPKGTTATVVPTAAGELTVYVSGGGVDMMRVIKRRPDGGLVLVNEHIYLQPAMQGKGLGTSVLASEIAMGQAMGVAQMETFAAKGAGLVGYKVWPLFGYDGPIPAGVAVKLPESLAGSTRLSDLMATPEGRQFWSDNGVGVHLTFDLTPGSKSMEVWNAYRSGKGK